MISHLSTRWKSLLFNYITFLKNKKWNYTLLGLRDESLDNKPNIAIVIKKKAVVYTKSFKVNISFKFFILEVIISYVFIGIVIF